MKNLSLYLSLIAVVLFFTACSTTSRLSCPDFKQSYKESKGLTKRNNQKVTKQKKSDSYVHQQKTIKEKLPPVALFSRPTPKAIEMPKVSLGMNRTLQKEIRQELPGMIPYPVSAFKKDRKPILPSIHLKNTQEKKQQRMTNRMEKKIKKINKIIEKKANKAKDGAVSTVGEKELKSEPSGIAGALGLLVGFLLIASSSSLGSIILLLGVFSLVAILIGRSSFKKIKQNPQEYKGKGLADLLVILGIVGLGLSILMMFVLITTMGPYAIFAL